MRLSRVVMRRGNQEAILQGMVHIAPDKIYAMLQGDVNWATTNNYQIFFEGIKEGPAKKPSTPNERKVRKFFLFLWDLYPAFTSALGVSLQKEGIAYPKDAVNADITFAEFTKRLDENGFTCNFFLWLFGVIGKREFKGKMKEELAKRGGLNALMSSSERWSFGKLAFWFLFRKATPIILDYRNEVAVTKVRTHSDERNIFIHYGEKHIKGLMGLLRQEGWVVKETTYIDLAEFC